MVNQGGIMGHAAAMKRCTAAAVPRSAAEGRGRAAECQGIAEMLSGLFEWLKPSAAPKHIGAPPTPPTHSPHPAGPSLRRLPASADYK